MISAAPPKARDSQLSPQPNNCSTKPEQRGHPIAMQRMMGLETACPMLGGKTKLAAVMGVCPRDLSYKLSAERGISNLDLVLTAKALETRGNKMLEHAAKLRAVLAPSGDHAAPLMLEPR